MGASRIVRASETQDTELWFRIVFCPQLVMPGLDPGIHDELQQ
jgi:hypothetical protein